MATKNKMEDLRNHLFAALEGLSDEEKPLDIDRARAIADVATVIVNSAKVEVDFIKQTGRNTESNFISEVKKLD
jgi:hypothetical protein